MVTEKISSEFQVIGFDADDTLWENETLFYNAKKKITEVLENNNDNLDQELLKVEKQNLQHYGYGIKGFILSLIETTIKLSDKNVDNQTTKEILNLGKKMLSETVKILPNVKACLEALSKNYSLILIIFIYYYYLFLL